MESQQDRQRIETAPRAFSGKKPYRKPELTPYSDIRDITMAPSPGMFESGLGAGFKSPGEGGSQRHQGERDPRDKR